MPDEKEYLRNAVAGLCNSHANSVNNARKPADTKQNSQSREADRPDQRCPDPDDGE